MHLDWKSAQQFTKNPVKITLPGPMTITDSIANNYYDDMKKLGFDLALALNKEVITDQVSAGIDVPTDGEVRRESYVLYQCRFLNGVSFKEVTHKSVRQGAFEADLPTIVAPISSKEIRMHLDWKSAQQFTKNPVKITLPGPMLSLIHI